MLHSIYQQIWKTQRWPQDWKRSVFIPIPKKGNAKECSNYRTIALILHTSKVMLKILQARLQQHMNQELPDIQAVFRKGRRTWIIENTKEFHKNIYFCITDYAKAFDCVDHNKLRKILQEMGIPNHLICLLRNLYAVQEATIRTGHGKTDWFQNGKGIRQGCILSPYLFILHGEYICGMPGWMKHKLDIRLPGEISITWYTDDITLIGENRKELRSFFMKVKEESEKAGLKLKFQKTKIMASGPITSWQIDGETMKTVTDYFLGLQNHCRSWL